MKSNFEEKRESRIERLKELAERKAQLSNQLWEKSNRMASVIPMGQPILVGHHSEKGDRAYRAKIDNTMGRAVQEADKAEYYERLAKSAESNHAISSDDPNALDKLREKLANLEKLQELMKACNKIIKSKSTNKNAEMIAAGLPEKYAVQIQQPDFCGRTGFPSFKLTNNNSNMRRIKERIAYLEKIAAADHITREIGDITVEQSPEHNRIMILFPGKPSDEIRSMCKSAGFRWAPSVSAWVAYLNKRNFETAIQIAEKANK